MMDFDELISQMTLEEKASLCSGEDFWNLKSIIRLGIPMLMVTDGPHGLRKSLGKGITAELGKTVPATCFPTASALAATWNRELVFEVGEALADECKQEKIGVILGPGANIKRSPLCGRNFEYFSEDPYLSGEIAKSHINGVQSKGIGTSLKHYVANNQEHRRMTIDAVVDERALREIYLAGYEIAVREAQPWTVMCAYNRINGKYASEHDTLMTRALKEEWGHEGIVVTDWGAMNDRVTGLKAGVELEMPGTNRSNDQQIVDAVKSGELDEAVLDRAARRLVTLILKAAETLAEDYQYDVDAHHALARKVAGEGAVLLKNDDALLPLAKTAKIAVLGSFAKTPRYQGAGSSLMNPTRLDNLFDEMAAMADENPGYAAGYLLKGEAVDDGVISEAIELAKTAEIAVVCVGLPDQFEVEGVDREHMRLPESHNALVEAVAAVNPRTIVVLCNGSPVEMPWVEQVPAVLEGYLGGQAGAGALADILFGDVNPSGKLAESFPRWLADNPSNMYFPGGPATVEYRESIYVGYRYYDTANQDVLYPFGHGISYTRFEYSDIVLDKSTLTDSEALEVRVKIKNIGEIAGKEIVQVYVRDVESTAFRPEKELKGFAKVALAPGEEKEVTINLDPRAFAYYNTGLDQWHIESGEFEILVGVSSRDIRLKADIRMNSSQSDAPAADRDALAVYYHPSRIHEITQSEFEAVLGRKTPANQKAKKGEYDINTPIRDMRDSFIGRLLGKFMMSQVAKMTADLEDDNPTAILFHAMAVEAPLRTMLMTGEGLVNRQMLDGMLLMTNGMFFKGLMAVLKASRKK